MTTWTPQQAANETGMSRSTIMRKIKAGEFPNAEMVKGTWHIPVTDLGAAGLRPGRPSPPDHDGDHDHDQDMTDQVTKLTTQLAEERQRRAVAEAIAQERERTIAALSETISDYRRMLPAPEQPTAEPITPEAPPSSPSQRPGPLRRFLQRLTD